MATQKIIQIPERSPAQEFPVGWMEARLLVDLSLYREKANRETKKPLTIIPKCPVSSELALPPGILPHCLVLLPRVIAKHRSQWTPEVKGISRRVKHSFVQTQLFLVPLHQIFSKVLSAV